METSIDIHHIEKRGVNVSIVDSQPWNISTLDTKNFLIYILNNEGISFSLAWVTSNLSLQLTDIV